MAKGTGEDPGLVGSVKNPGAGRGPQWVLLATLPWDHNLASQLPTGVAFGRHLRGGHRVAVCVFLEFLCLLPSRSSSCGPLVLAQATLITDRHSGPLPVPGLGSSTLKWAGAGWVP